MIYPTTSDLFEAKRLLHNLRGCWTEIGDLAGHSQRCKFTANSGAGTNSAPDGLPRAQGANSAKSFEVLGTPRTEGKSVSADDHHRFMAEPCELSAVHYSIPGREP